MRAFIGVLLALFVIAAIPADAIAFDLQDQAVDAVAPDVAFDVPVTLSTHAAQSSAAHVEPLPAHSARLEVIPRAGEPSTSVVSLRSMVPASHTMATVPDGSATEDTYCSGA